MEADLKSSTARGATKGKVVTVYSSYAANAKNSSAVSVTRIYQPNYSSSIDASNVDDLATAYIVAVRERFKKEQWM
ncbi:hypothetical protein GUJ93_ZPchr0019g2657 [Zizania palustris]|uniref:Uncharacterized protein n=1 Tax=Zizania palustris TaxID=103762 RepID=A0A8J5W6P4_ZIZPA|nr:hypothetical protein GUJ93_ZPchr0001g30492 [Zizania palustris]KAG8081709.1 hypothetical protein GUJ93_ZPchr0019g2657 [Zizania palustris]